MARESVKLNVYDMASINQYTSRLGVGVFHSGIEVYGTEYGYGGHPYDFTGIFEIEPRDEESLGEDIFKYRETIVLGETDFTDNEIRQLVQSIGHLFKGIHYHLLHQNCNHFCDHLAKTLCGQGLPNWVNRLAYISTCVPFLEKCLPREFLTPIALEQDIRLHVQQAEAGRPLFPTDPDQISDLNHDQQRRSSLQTTNASHPNCILMNPKNHESEPEQNKNQESNRNASNLFNPIKANGNNGNGTSTPDGSSSANGSSSSKAATASRLLFNSFCSRSKNSKSDLKVSNKVLVKHTTSDASDETNSSLVNEESSINDQVVADERKTNESSNSDQVVADERKMNESSSSFNRRKTSTNSSMKKTNSS